MKRHCLFHRKAGGSSSNDPPFASATLGQEGFVEGAAETVPAELAFLPERCQDARGRNHPRLCSFCQEAWG